MWKAVSSRRELDDEFVAWSVKAESDDGRERIMYVKIAVSIVAETPWTTAKGSLRQVRDAIETRGASLVEVMQDREELPNAVVYRSGAADFVEE